MHAVHENNARGPWQFKGKCECDGDLRLVHKTEDNYAALQVCISQYGWRYITPSGWTPAAARLACRQLRYNMSEKQNNSNPKYLYVHYFYRRCIRKSDVVQQCIHMEHTKR